MQSFSKTSGVLATCLLFAFLLEICQSTVAAFDGTEVVTVHRYAKEPVLNAVAKKAAVAVAEPRTIVSPQVHPDHTVTFRFSGGDFESVKLVLGNNRPLLKRDTDGVWETTVQPLQPGIHEYWFEVDGARVTDPRNRWTKKWLMCASLFEIPSSEPLLTQQNKVPHGAVHRHLYESQTTNRQRAAIVYTPPGYDREAKQPYPLLVLCHGFGDDETAWTEVGRAHHILDNLIAAGKIQPLVVVMPNGHPLPIDQRTMGYDLKNGEMLVADVANDLLPLVERQYHVDHDPQRRAITGLSMGGGHSMLTTMAHPDKFAWIGAFSAGTPEGEFEKDHPEWIESAGESNLQRRLFWIACGKDDFLLKRNQDFVGQLKQHGIEHTFVETEGGHSWTVWREYLPNFLQLIFR